VHSAFSVEVEVSWGLENFFFFFFAQAGLELQAAQFQLLVKMRSPKLFAWAGLET
jgi:hypothetical protein